MRTLDLAQCKEAISNWNVTIKDRDKITSLLQPNFNVRITKEVYSFLEENNDNDNFHIYMGVVNYDEIIMIFVPLSSDGTEKLDLLNFAISGYENLEAPLVLREAILGDSESRYVISPEYLMGGILPEQSPSAVKPMVNINQALVNLMNWKLGYEDWIDFEIRREEDSKIFKAFSVGIQDLIMEFNKSWVEHISCLFVLERGNLFEEITPNVVFVSSYNNDSDPDPGSEVLTNVYDFGSPCPPFCDRGNFTLL